MIGKMPPLRRKSVEPGLFHRLLKNALPVRDSRIGMMIACRRLRSETIKARRHFHRRTRKSNQSDINRSTTGMLRRSIVRIRYKEVIVARGIPKGNLSRGRTVGIPNLKTIAPLFQKVIRVLEALSRLRASQRGHVLPIEWSLGNR